MRMSRRRRGIGRLRRWGRGFFPQGRGGAGKALSGVGFPCVPASLREDPAGRWGAAGAGNFSRRGAEAQGKALSGLGSPCGRASVVLHRSGFLQTIHATGDAVLENSFAEVEQVAELESGESEIGLHLLFVDWAYPLNGLQFHQNLARDDQIGAEAFRVAFASEAYRYLGLALDEKSISGEFAGEDSFVNGFQQSWAELTVDVYGCNDDLGADLVLSHVRVSAEAAD